MITVTLSNTWCDEHLTRCWQSYNDATGEHQHIEDYTTARHHLEAHGYYYAGHRAGMYTFCCRKSSPLAQPGLDWQIAAEAHTAKAAAKRIPSAREAQILAELGYT